jgi:hypothetical protein
MWIDDNETYVELMNWSTFYFRLPIRTKFDRLQTLDVIDDSRTRGRVDVSGSCVLCAADIKTCEWTH